MRQFLGRLSRSSPAARAAVGGRLADAGAGARRAATAAGTPPEEFLAAVVATRRERDTARLAREAALRERLTSSR